MIVGVGLDTKVLGFVHLALTGFRGLGLEARGLGL